MFTASDPVFYFNDVLISLTLAVSGHNIMKHLTPLVYTTLRGETGEL